SRSLRGCRAGNDSICARISGDALSRNQASPSALTATLSCRRASMRTDPSLAPRQLEQAQFHCGQPPPAADPSTRMSISPRALYDRRSPDVALMLRRRSALSGLGEPIEVGLGLGIHLDLFEGGRRPAHGAPSFVLAPQSGARQELPWDPHTPRAR